MDSVTASQDPAPMHTFLNENDQVEFIRYQWLDFSGILRQRILTKTHCLSLIAEGKHHGIGPALMQSINISPQAFVNPLKQELFELHPDWTSLRICHFAPHHAQVMCFVYCKDADDPLYLCPRRALLRALERCNELDIALRVGFEIEFVLLDTKLKPLDGPDNVYAWATAAGLRDQKLQLMEEVVRIVQKSDIPVLAFHTEQDPQLEFSTGHFPPLQAVDALIYTHELLRCISLRHGMRATLAPKPTINETVNTCHTHVSISRTEVFEHFLAGILDRLPLLCAFSLPHYDSYFATIDGACKTGIWIGYGTENRDLPIRKISTSDAHFEYRPADCTANFYIFMALLIHCGLDGIEKDLALDPWQDVRMFPSWLSHEEKQKLGLTKHLPRSLSEAVEALEDCKAEVDERLGREMTRIYTGMKKAECSLVKMPDDERRSRYIRYF